MYSLPGALTGGDLALHRGGGDRGKQGLVLLQWIDVAFVQHTVPLQQAHDPLGRRLDDLLHVVIGQLRCTHEIRRAIYAGDVDAVRYQHVKVRIQIER